MRGDEQLPVPTELKRCTVVLADQVTQSRLGEADPRAQLGRVLDGPLEFLWCRLCSVRYPSGWFHGFQMKECGRARVDGACEEHEALSKDIRRIAEKPRFMEVTCRNGSKDAHRSTV